MNEDIVVVGYKRSPIGALSGSLSSLTSCELGAGAIAGAVQDAGIDAASVDSVIMGCVLQAGLGQAPARQAALGAGLLPSSSCSTVNKVCGSGMQSIIYASQALRLAEADFVVAGGMESMSGAPHLLSKARKGYRLGHGELSDHMFLDGLQDATTSELMGFYAEDCAEKYQFSRKAQDRFAIRSLERAQQSIRDGLFQREIAPVHLPRGSIIVSDDELPLILKSEKIPTLKPAFVRTDSPQSATVTAANASSIADGAAAVVLTRKSVALAHGLPILAKISAYSYHSHEPKWFTTAPVSAIAKLLEMQGLSTSDIDLYEINEAFAVVTMAAIEELGLDEALVNIRGGACALGHPLGATGTRIVTSLLASLESEDKCRGLASLCIGGGEALAMILERD
ncbi:MAG: acetyl-CoA C-acetyltransferase [Flavobacteriales bacterium]|jgi:acetyl-CoA C-acetyltransferase